MSEPFRIFETDVFLEDLEKLQPSIKERIKSKLKKDIYSILRQQPHHGKNIKKLVNYSPETWRYRVGDFRIFYTIKDKTKIISILTISDRKDSY